ncbi:hypothetical protein OS493_010619 [Desmophyllum pertusum]|uniref:DNA-3-methyladenine glycosylase n=1 Tax=Desmophyllum pertusum TaxID=174260 RepID=A0A9W9ZS94_9CNID|nr:hypothetical protein OS493_010619 [Desmophyllum pertusum]
MAARKASKRRNVKSEENYSEEFKGKGEKSIYFKSDSSDSLSVSPSKKAKLKHEKTSSCSTKLGRCFYNRATEDLAKQLLGKLLYRVLDNGEVLCGRIVETEGYLGEVDKACHAFGGKRTARCEPMYMAPGTAYVYIIYGMYHCLNISSQEPGACVLIRAMEPLQGLNSMKSFRGVRRRDGGNKLKDFELSNGPSKLCQALCIEKANLNKEDMTTSNRFWLEDDKNCQNEDITIVTSTRIGIDSYGPEWALKPLRFYVLGNKCVSVKDKKAESELLTPST